jgi:hypothetical protein
MRLGFSGGTGKGLSVSWVGFQLNRDRLLMLSSLYREIKPWLPSYPQELQKAIELGASAEEKLKYPMPPELNVGTSVVYQDKECGQFIQ